ncbi:MAG: TetR/AcrR family transcriptional regulator [Gammaproteobacteria bacterium]|nr:TetR/AcrR family transcriptional regulator [Gammaproteobacteria bacterium]
MARPIEYDEEEVLARALEQFWREGYEASSVNKLLDCCDINRGTLYNSFTDKNTFFKIVINHYNDLLDRQVAASLKNPALGTWESITTFFDEAVVNVRARQRNLGCLLVNSLCSSVNYDGEIKRVLRASLNRIRKALVERLREARTKGKLKKGLDEYLAADILMNALYGIRVNSRNGKSARQLESLANHAISSLRK